MVDIISAMAGSMALFLWLFSDSLPARYSDGHWGVMSGCQMAFQVL
jgi:hypothetical protein